MSLFAFFRGLESMAMEGKVVSKRSGRAYNDEADEPKAMEPRNLRSTKYEEALFETQESVSSSSTTTASSRTSFSVGEGAEAEEILQSLRTKANALSVSGSECDLRAAAGVQGVKAEGSPGSVISAEASEEHRSSTADPILRSPHLHEEAFNFGTVVPGVYRSSYPRAQNYTFVQGLGLKTIVTLVSKDLPDGYQSFMSDNGIRHVVIHMKGTKKEEIPIKTMKSILRLVLDRQNHPLLIHCNHGKHRTGCVVAVVRKLSGWQLPNIIDEYKAFAGAKVRECDIKYITAFDLSQVSNVLVRQSNIRHRVRTFFRVSIFACFVLLLWLLSVIKMVATQRKLRNSKE